MFRHYRVILRQPVINTVPSYTSISNAAVGNTIYTYDVTIINIFYYSVLWPKNAHNYSTNYHTATCFDTIVSSSESSGQHYETGHTTRHTLTLGTYRASTTVTSTCRLYIQPPRRLTVWEL